MARRQKNKEWWLKKFNPQYASRDQCYFVTLRIFDSLPYESLTRLRYDQWSSESERRKFLENELDKNYGPCFLNRKQIADIVEEILFSYHTRTYHLIAHVLMPNHMHILIEPMRDQALDKILTKLKSFTAKQANEELRRIGSFWSRDHYTRTIRTQDHYYKAVRYIHRNPVKAGLVSLPSEWPFSSMKLVSEEMVANLDEG